MSQTWSAIRSQTRSELEFAYHVLSTSPAASLAGLWPAR